MRKLLFAIFCVIFASPACADWGLVDSLNLAPFVPLVLDSLLSVASATYDFFVGRGGGIIYILIWGWLGISIGLFLVKMYLPRTWLSFFNFTSDVNFADGKVKPVEDIGYNLLKPALRAIIAATLLLQVRPALVTEWLIDPFLRFGALYTTSITDTITQGMPIGSAANDAVAACSGGLVEQGFLSQSSCEFLVRPINEITHANNEIIKRGLDFANRGIRGLMTLIPHGGESFLNIVTGFILVFTFVGMNFFMALLIIQGIFNFGIALILYPFKVLMYVAKPKDKKAWVDPWPAFDDIIKSLKDLVITMIACAVILVINIAVIRALFNWESSVFSVSAPVAPAIGFGQHSVMWLSSILTFFLMFQIFKKTEQKLNEYASGMDGMYKKVSADTKSAWGNIGKLAGAAKKAIGGIFK